jgi:hypothetical protein
MVRTRLPRNRQGLLYPWYRAHGSTTSGHLAPALFAPEVIIGIHFLLVEVDGYSAAIAVETVRDKRLNAARTFACVFI